MKQKPILVIDNISFKYKNHKHYLYKDFSLKIKKGEIIAIIGPSGAGKSTLFELILGNIKPLKGKIKKPKKITEVFQDPYTSFHPSYTILEQIKDALGTEYKSTNIKEIAKKLSIEKEIYKKPHHLSGGQLQRCSILRALSMKADLLLLDEPTSAVDKIQQVEIMRDIIRDLKKYGVILITHDEEMGRWCADRVIEVGGLKIKN